MHTLISALANGARLKRSGTESEKPILGEVLSHPPLYYVHAKETLGMGHLLWVSACILVSFLFFPLFTFTLSMERKSGLLALMKVQGLLLSAYWLANYVYFFALYGITMAFYFCFLSAIAGSGSKVMMRDWSQLYAILFAWGHAQNGLALFVSYFLAGSEAIVAVTYLIVILTILAGQIFVLIIPPPWPTALFFYPPLNFVRSISLWIKTEVPAGSDLYTEMTASEADEYSGIVGIQLLMGTALCLVSAALHVGWAGRTKEFIAGAVMTKSKRSGEPGDSKNPYELSQVQE